MSEDTIFIELEDLVANALIELIENKGGTKIVTFNELTDYGKAITRISNNKGIDVVILFTKEYVDKLLYNYPNFFNVRDSFISLKYEKTSDDLRKYFRAYMSIDMLLIFQDEEALQELGIYKKIEEPILEETLIKEKPDKYQTMCDTYKHKRKVNELVNNVIHELSSRAISHDDSKIECYEVDMFTEYTSRLSGMTYGSEEYKQCLLDMKPALDHHYAANKHHPQHYVGGIKDMDLVDLVEMICDWKAATLRHSDGDINKSLEINQERFGYSDELKGILKNTLKYL